MLVCKEQQIGPTRTIAIANQLFDNLLIKQEGRIWMKKRKHGRESQQRAEKQRL